LHPSPCLLTPPLGTADLTIEGDAFAVEANDREALSTLFAAYASFLHRLLVPHEASSVTVVTPLWRHNGVTVIVLPHGRM